MTLRVGMHTCRIGHLHYQRVAGRADMNNQMMAKPSPRKLSNFSTGCHRQKYFLLFALVLACIFVLSTEQVRADGYTITFTDINNSLGVTVTGQNTVATITSYGCIASTNEEHCSVNFTPLSRFYSAGPDRVTAIAEDATLTNQSDRFVLLTDFLRGGTQLNFWSNNISGIPCALFGSCQLFEDGTVQQGTTIQWTSPTNTITDTILFQSGDNGATPEPSSVLLFG